MSLGASLFMQTLQHSLDAGRQRYGIGVGSMGMPLIVIAVRESMLRLIEASSSCKPEERRAEATVRAHAD
jgi:hypothetical protein